MTKWDYLIESDASLRALERRWIETDSRTDLKRYLMAVVRKEGRFEVGRNNLYIFAYRSPGSNGLTWRVTRYVGAGPHNYVTSGMDTTLEGSIDSIINLLYTL